MEEYFINRHSGGNWKFIAIEGEPVTFDGFPEFDFFIHAHQGGLAVSEAKSGGTIAVINGTSKQAKSKLLQKAAKVLNDIGIAKLNKNLKNAIDKYGLSPRYENAGLSGIKKIHEPGLRIIYNYCKLHGTNVGKGECEKLLLSVQRFLKAHKEHPYHSTIVVIGEQLSKLKKAYKSGEKIPVLIAKGKEYREIIEKELGGLGVLPVMIAAAAGAAVEHVIHKTIKKKNKALSGIPKVKKRKASKKKPAAKKQKSVGALYPETRKKFGPISSLGFVRADQDNDKSPDTFQLPGEIGKLLGNLQPFRLSIVITGEPHATKTEFLWQVLNAFAASGRQVYLFDLEQGGLSSKDTKAARDRNVDADNIKNIHVTGEGSIKEVKALAASGQAQVIAIDSFQKLKSKPTEFDDLRTQFPNVIWIAIFQLNSEGKTRGGNTPDYDSPVYLKAHRPNVMTRDENFIEVIKNRGNELTSKYMIIAKKTIPLTQNINENGKKKQR